ncbi:MAG: VWA domain-containing protein [Acidobacteria bacterium]|nr:MAG: VWA domain-containing protein [Acidobacteriota bacterium]
MRLILNFLLCLLIAGCVNFILVTDFFSQARPQRSEPAKGNQKKNPRVETKSEEELRREEEERKRLEEEKKAVEEKGVIRIETKLVNVDAVVYNKKSGQIITGLKKENFAVFDNGVRKEIVNFSNPESPITVALVVEYSKWTEVFGYYGSRGLEPGKYEVIRPVAYFLSRFIKPPDDYACVIAFDMRPTPIVDFTNDSRKLRATVDLLLRNFPAFRENNLFDAVQFTLYGGKAESVVLENSKEENTEYSGMVAVKAKRKAIILVASGIDTFSRTSYDEVRKGIQRAGIPIYVIGTANMFYKLYEPYLGATDSISGMPGRLTFLQAQNTLNTFAKESGGQYFPMTFESEIPSILESINALLRNQYSLAFDPGENAKDGKRHKIEIKVDVNGDGVFDDKDYVVQHRPFYFADK